MAFCSIFMMCISLTLTYSSFLSGVSIDNRIHPLSDNSGYYFTGKDSLSVANVWKYRYTKCN